MRYFIGVFFISILLLSSCGAPDPAEIAKAKQDSIAKAKAEARPVYQKAIDDAEKAMRSDKTYDKRLMTAALKAYNDFTVTFPDDSMTAEYLFLSSSLAQAAGNYQQATVYLETIIEKHKDYKKYSDACFLAAFIYDTYLENVNEGGARAKQLYQFVIDHYPNTKNASDAKVLITHLGHDDSWIDSLIKNGQKK
jgi:TolA-binding protein